jgi:2-succinyl-5-enolpyruvyl-6-hydroxy-3-cyclohexene-1-carboxylate synthase
MVTSSKINAQLIVQQCFEQGMKHVVCSPGSRNAPLVIAFDEHPEIQCTVIHDERSAAFFALGMAQQLDQPIGIVCTSGSAALNYYPAIAEAFYQCVPLVVLTADRPTEWINQGDGQTIVQSNVFGKHVRYSANFSEHAQTTTEQWYIQREISTAFAEGTTHWKGPIHFNIAFNEPLYKTEEFKKHPTKKINLIQSRFQFSNQQQQAAINALGLAKKMVICGQLQEDPALLEQLKIFANDSSVVVLVENTSNLVDPKFLHCIDRTLNSIEEALEIDYAPDLLITIGGAVVSKKIKAFIRKHQPKEHWKIGFEFPYMDTYQALTHSFQAEPFHFFHSLNELNYNKNTSNYGSKWKQLDYLIQDKMPTFFEKCTFADISTFDIVLDYLPENCHLHLANSSVVRYAQLFDPIKSITYWSNRGTSGIDGSSSTAVGAAHANPEKLHVLITGDVSFFYDSNAFWNQYLTQNLRIILINNAGGGIFKIIAGPDTSKQSNDYFVAQHHHTAEGICQAFNMHYSSVDSLEALADKMSDFYTYSSDNRPKLLEIFTPSELNPEALEAFFHQLKIN